jgi:hypothetical protein
LLDGLLIASVVFAVMLLAILTFFRRKMGGLLTTLRNRFPNALVIPVVLDDSQDRVVSASLKGGKSSLRLPGYVVLVMSGSSVAVWNGRRPKLVAEWTIQSPFRDGVANTLARSRAIEVEVATREGPMPLVFIPTGGASRLYPRPLSDIERALLLGKLNSTD